MEALDRILGFDLPFLINWGFQIVNTLIIVFVMSKVLYQPVKNFMKNRSDRIKSQLDSAESDFKEAKALKETYESKLKNIEKERNEILSSAKAQATEKENQIINAAKEEARILKERALLDIQREKDKAKDEMKNQIISLSTVMAGRFVNAKMDDRTQNKLLDEVIADLGAKEWVS